MAQVDYLIKEIWEDGAETLYVLRAHENDELLPHGHPLARAKERWDIIAFVHAQHGTTIIRPERFEVLSSTVYKDRKFYWHPNTTLSTLKKTVFLLDEKEHYYEYA